MLSAWLYHLPVSRFSDSVAVSKFTILSQERKSETSKAPKEKIEKEIEISEEEKKERNVAKMAGNIRTASKEKAVLLLKCWVPKHRKPKATEKTVVELKTLKLQSAI